MKLFHVHGSITASIICCNLIFAAPPLVKTESFDQDPGWEEHNNRVMLSSPPIVKQDFGYSKTQNAGRTVGEIGGRITRTARPAYYAEEIAVRTLNDPLISSGSFAIKKSQPGAGVFFGWFNSKQPGSSGRPIGSLGLNLDFESNGGRLAIRLLTNENQGCGTFVTKYEQYRTIELKKEMRPTPLKNDGTRYRWTLSYDPQANGGSGAFDFTLTIENGSSNDFEGQTFSVNLPAGYKQQGTAFDRFGVMNMMKAGGVVEIYFADLQVDGHTIDFSADPGWISSGNRGSYEDREQVGAHNFGYTQTNHAEGKRGEIGGDLWRSGNYAYYADRVGPLDLSQRLEASGKVKLVVGGPDADMMLGWFNSSHQEKSPLDAGDFLGIAVGGPTSVGHCFAPSVTTSKATRMKLERGPVLKPGRCYEWKLVYEPTGHNGLGEITLTFGEQTVTLPFKPGRRVEGATFDRFGLFTSQAGGQLVRIFFDDLIYTQRTW